MLRLNATIRVFSTLIDVMVLKSGELRQLPMFKRNTSKQTVSGFPISCFCSKNAMPHTKEDAAFIIIKTRSLNELSAKYPPINEQIAAASVVNAIVFPNILAEPNIWTTHKSITALKNNVPAVEIVFDDSNAFSTISPSITKNPFKLIIFSQLYHFLLILQSINNLFIE